MNKMTPNVVVGIFGVVFFSLELIGILHSSLLSLIMVFILLVTNLIMVLLEY